MKFEDVAGNPTPIGFVVERWARIETFVPEDFWYLELMLRVPSQPTKNAASETAPAAQNNNSGRPITFSWNRGRLSKLAHVNDGGITPRWQMVETSCSPSLGSPSWWVGNEAAFNFDS